MNVVCLIYLSCNIEVAINVTLGGEVKRKGWLCFFALNSTKNDIDHQFIFAAINSQKSLLPKAVLGSENTSPQEAKEVGMVLDWTNCMAWFV